MEEWEKVDVGEVRAPGSDTLPSTPTTSKSEVATQDLQHTTTREAHRDVCYRAKTSGEDTIDAPLWKYHGTHEDDVSWRSQGAHGINLCGRQLVLLTRHLVPNKAIHLGNH